MRTQKIWGAVILIAVVAPQLAAGATSRPPRKSSPPDGWVKVESATDRVTFYVPKQWTDQGTDGSWTFDLTPPKMKEKGRDFGTLTITATKGEPGTLETKVADLRESLPKSAPGSSLIRDQAIFMGEHPAWEFVLQTVTKSEESTPSSYGGPPIVHTTVKRSHAYTAVAVDGDMVYEVNLKAEGAAFGSGVSMVNRVLETFEIAPSGNIARAAVGTPGSAPAAAGQTAPDDTVKIENSTYHYQFFVPKAWQRKTVNSTEVAYLLPPHSPHARAGLFLLVAGKSQQATLEEAVDEERKTLSSNGQTRLVENKAIELDGKPAWVVVVESSAIENHPAKPGQSAGHVKHLIKDYHIVSMAGGFTYNISFTGEGDDYDGDLAAVKKVIDGFTWTSAGIK